MLVLSRRANQSVVFPTLGITVEVLQTKGNSVRLGITAPKQVDVLREELLTPEQAAAPASIAPTVAKHAEWTREIRGRLNTAVMGLYVVEKQLEAGLTDDAQVTLLNALRTLESLEQKLNPEQPATPKSPSPKMIHALLVEDDRNEEALLASYLRMSGFEVQTVHDGYEALEFLSSHERPDFVLLDMRLPRLNGPSTIAAIRQNPAYDGVKIFAVSGSSPEEIEDVAGAGAVDGWFQKPLNPAQIAQAMNAVAENN